MSEFLRAAREKLRGALADIDARLAELQAFKAEEAQLCDHRAQLVTLLGDPVPAEERPVYRPEPGAVTTVASGTAPTEARPPAEPETGITRHSAAAARILVVVERKGQATSSDVKAAARLPNDYAVKRLLNELIDAKLLVRTGKTHGTRYSLPGQDAAPADSEGDRGGRRGRR